MDIFCVKYRFMLVVCYTTCVHTALVRYVLNTKGGPLLMENLLNLEVTYFNHRQASTWQLNSPEFNRHGILLVLDGRAEYILNGRTYHLEAGSMLCFHPGCTRRGYSSEGMTYAAIDFQVKAGALVLPELHRFVYTDELRRLLRDFQQEWLQRGEGFGLRCGALLVLILHQLLCRGTQAHYNHHVERIKQHIVENYQKTIQVRQMAEMVGLNTAYCGTLFRRTEGVTMAEYANRIRVSKAATLLEEGELTMTEIAELCGFSDVFYFGAVFRRIVGVSPGRLRGTQSFLGNAQPCS